jgi:hypothetical protein
MGVLHLYRSLILDFCHQPRRAPLKVIERVFETWRQRTSMALPRVCRWQGDLERKLGWAERPGIVLRP